MQGELDLSKVHVPAGMVVVSHGEFWAYIMAATIDIMPRNTAPHYTDWETRDRRAIGRSYPGWKNPGDERGYMLAESARASLRKAAA